MPHELRVQLSEQGADEERLEEFTGFVREELLQLNVQDVTRPAAGPPPPGTRSIDPVVVGELVVQFGPHAAATLGVVVSVIKRWLGLGGGTRRSVRLEIDGDVLELSEATAEDQDQLVSFFVSRHTPGDGTQWTANARP